VAESPKIHPLVRLIWRIDRLRGRFSLPVGETVGSWLYYGRPAVSNAWALLMQALMREPMLRYRCRSVGKGLRLDGPAPRIMGNGLIDIGDEVQFGDRVSLIVGMGLPEPAHLEIKSRITFLGNQFCSVAEKVSIGNYCLIGGNIYDNDLHPLDPEQRRQRFADMSLVKHAPVLIEDDVWVGANAIVLKGVTLHRGAIVAAGAVVTTDVPSCTIVAGNPARIVRRLDDTNVAETPAPATALPRVERTG